MYKTSTKKSFDSIIAKLCTASSEHEWIPLIPVEDSDAAFQLIYKEFDALYQLQDTIDLAKLMTFDFQFSEMLFTKLQYPVNTLFKFTNFVGVQYGKELVGFIQRRASEHGSSLVVRSSFTNTRSK